MHIHVDSLCCTPEVNVILSVNYTWNKNNRKNIETYTSSQDRIAGTKFIFLPETAGDKNIPMKQQYSRQWTLGNDRWWSLNDGKQLRGNPTTTRALITWRVSRSWHRNGNPVKAEEQFPSVTETEVGVQGSQAVCKQKQTNSNLLISISYQKHKLTQNGS